MNGLVQELQSAPHGTLALDAQIAVATFRTIYADNDLIYAKLPMIDDSCADGTFWLKSRSGMSLHTAPAYTRSIDAAINLLPAGWIWDVSSTGQAWAEALHGWPARHHYDGKAATPALALCVLALTIAAEPMETTDPPRQDGWDDFLRHAGDAYHAEEAARKAIKGEK